MELSYICNTWNQSALHQNNTLYSSYEKMQMKTTRTFKWLQIIVNLKCFISVTTIIDSNQYCWYTVNSENFFLYANLHISLSLIPKEIRWIRHHQNGRLNVSGNLKKRKYIKIACQCWLNTINLTRWFYEIFFLLSTSLIELNKLSI